MTFSFLTAERPSAAVNYCIKTTGVSTCGHFSLHILWKEKNNSSVSFVWRVVCVCTRAKCKKQSKKKTKQQQVTRREAGIVYKVECTESILNVNFWAVLTAEVKGHWSYFCFLRWRRRGSEGLNSLCERKEKKRKTRPRVYKAPLAEPGGGVLKETSRHFFKIYFYGTINEY